MTIREINQTQCDNLCRNITVLARRQELTMTQLSEKTGVPAKLLIPLEQMILSDALTAGHLLDLCEYFGCRLGSLLRESMGD